MINNLILNEKEYIEKFIKTKDLQGMDNFNFLLKLLIRYYNQYGEIDKNKIIELTKDLKENYLQLYQLDKRVQSVISKELENGIKLKEFDSIPLYQSELDVINSCKKNREKKFLFTCYMLSEFYRNEWINVSYTDLFKLANISMSTNDRLLFIGDMVDKKYIDISYSNTNLSLKIPMKKSGNIVYSIDKIENLGNKLIAFIKPNYIICQGIYDKNGEKRKNPCGKLVKIKNKNDHSTKYCKDCAEIMNRMLTLENYYEKKL